MSRDNDYISVRTGKGLHTEISVNGHTLVADEPKNLGGTGAGPDPYGYLVSALGACTAMTLRMYADRKGWSLDSVTVRLEHQKVHAKDCESCETENGKLDRIGLDIELEGDLEEDQREKLLEIAAKCPVHRTLTSETLIEFTPAGERA
ncbi:MAG: OsmC family protein [Actinomycetota bacterium]|nr:OsmC family protein [Actinomycetota bacterium]HZY64411.1 OsmC family protein [Rubrobacteraceae bacterium]